MAENAGTIYFTVEADTSKLVNGVKSGDAGLNRLERGLAKTDQAASKTDMRLTKVAVAIQGLGRSSTFAAGALSGLLPILSGAALVKVAQDIISTADAWTELQNRLRLVTDSQRELAQATEAVFSISQAASQEANTVAQVYQRFAQNADRLGLSLNDVAEVTDVVAKAVAISGASAESARAALVQFGQGLASGTLRGEELNSVLEQTPALAQAIAIGLGVTIGELRQLGQDGKITSEALIAALKKAGDSVNTQFDTRVKTAAQAWTELRNSVTRFVGELSGATNMSSSLADAITRVSQAIDSADIDRLAQELEGLKATVSLVMDGIESLRDVFTKSFPDMAKSSDRSITQMALSTAKEVDGLVATFQGAAGAVSAIWQGLAQNIPTFFTNAWNRVKSDAADLVNSLADMLNAPLQALGIAGFSKVTFGAQAAQAMVDLSRAAQDGWKAAAVGLGAYEKTLDRVTRNAIQSSVAEWVEAYGDSIKKATTETKKLEDATKKKKKALSEAEKAAQQNQQTLDKMAQSLYLAGLYGEELAVAQAKMSLNKFATPEQVQQVEALARALYQAEQVAKRAAALGDGPAEISKNILGDTSPLSGGAYDEQTSKFDEDLKREEERYWTQLTNLQIALDAERLTLEEHYGLVEQMAQQHSDRMQRIEQAKQATMYKTASSGLGAVADVMKTAYGEQSNIYRAMFAVSKAFAIAESIVKIQQGIASAAALPFPTNIPAMASVAAATAGIVASIQSVTMAGGRQYGGPVGPGRGYRINENGAPEILNMANGQQFLLPNSRGQVVSNKDATAGDGSHGQPQVIVNLIESRERAGQIEQYSFDQNQVIDAFVADIGTGGRASQALEVNYGLKRRGR